MGMVGGTRSYDGPGLGSAPWKCPRCAQQNTGAIDAGCVHCGSGAARPQHIGLPPPAEDLKLAIPPPIPESPEVQALRKDMEAGVAVYTAAEAWAAAHEGVASMTEAFVAGYRLATAQAQAHTMAAPPVTADVASLAPEGKPRRTIIAALELFKDQVLREAADEIASGEWCSLEEVDQLIQQLKDEEPT